MNANLLRQGQAVKMDPNEDVLCVKLLGLLPSLVALPTNGRHKERRCMIADAHEKPMFGASAHLIANAWTSADTFRRSLLPSLIASHHQPFFLTDKRLSIAHSPLFPRIQPLVIGPPAEPTKGGSVRRSDHRSPPQWDRN